MPASEKRHKGRRWQFAACEYFELSRRLVVSGQTVRMESKPLDVLLQLLEHPAEIVEKETLLSSVWPDVATTEQSLATAVSKLRKAFGGTRDSVILNEAGVGYRMAVPVTCVVDDEPGLVAVLLEPGDPIPRRPNWVAVKRLGADETAPVWLARNPKNGEERVYKFAGDGVRLRALQREVAVSRLLGKSLGPRACFAVRILDWGFEEPPYFIESEFAGLNLLEWSATDAYLTMPPEERVRLAAQLAGHVGAAHELGILHNDLKPGNILISRDAASPADRAPWQVKVADFGVASLEDVHVLEQMDISDHGAFSATPGEGQNTPLGTAMYRAPELGPGSAPTILGDVYALGVLLYQILCGDFDHPPVPGWEQRIADPLLREDIAAAANVDPKRRITGATALAERLHTLTERRERAQQAEAEAAHAREAVEALARTRLRRPWVVLAVTSLSFGLLVTLWSAHRAKRERDAEREHAAALSAMYGFLAQDLLGQSNPYLGVAGSGRAPQQTLLDAIATATPQIDGRFARQPEIAARLHETVADSLRSRTRSEEADREYAIAAQHYREAGGPLAQSAIITELKREFAGIAAMMPGSIEAARDGYARQEKLIAQIREPSVELETWRTLVKTGLIGLGPHPEAALPLLTEAVRRAEASPGMDPQLLFRLKNQFCGTYVRLGDGPNLERVSQEIIAMLTRQHGRESATLFPFQMYLEEAFYLQGNYPAVIAQADRNFAEFTRILGPEHQLTLATLATRAAAEGQLEQYEAAVRDDLALHEAERRNPNPAGKRMEEGSLNDAALYECHLGRLQAGLEHAREVIRETAPGAAGQPAFYNGSMYTVADCLLAGHPDRNALNEAEALLRRIDVRVLGEFSGDTHYEGAVDLALARVAMLRGDRGNARLLAAKAEPLLKVPGGDPYQQKLLASLQQELASRPAP